MVKSQQQVSANQGRLDAFMTQSQPSTSAAAASAMTAAPAASTAGPGAPSAALQEVPTAPPRPTAASSCVATSAGSMGAPPAGNVAGRPSWVKPVTSIGGGLHKAAAPRDITNVPPKLVSSPAKHQMPNTVSPAKQTRLQSFFQPKQVSPAYPVQQQQQQPQQRHLHRPQSQQLHCQQQPRWQQQQQQQHSWRPHGQQQQQQNGCSVSVTMQSRLQDPDTQHHRQQHGLQKASAQTQGQQQQAQQQLQCASAPKPAAQVSGVFADDDGLDDFWMSDQLLEQAARRTPVAPAQAQSVLAVPVIDLSGSPVHKRTKF